MKTIILLPSLELTHNLCSALVRQLSHKPVDDQCSPAGKRGRILLLNKGEPLRIRRTPTTSLQAAQRE